MPINVLDRHTAELIAAGEVVERPASVAKELLENAVDAGATAVTLEIERGGIALLRVADNGCGIAPAELPLAFVRHATSKVKTAADLDAIATLGFRGEALASIGSVARVRLLSHAAGEADAAELSMAGGEAGEVNVAARGRGTTVEVRDLFYNTPARMKFLKKDSSEGTFVNEVAGRVAISRAEVAFTFVRDGKAVFSTPGDGDVKAAAWQVLGREFARDLTAVNSADGPYKVSGLVTQPGAGRASRAMQLFFINGRYVKNNTMMAALEQAYRGLAMQGRFPGGLLFLMMPPELVDVNVHPAKTQVRFAHEQEVFGAVYRAVRAALMEAAGEHARLDLGNPHGTEAAPQAEAPRPRPTEAAYSRPAPPPAAQVRAYNEMVANTAAISGAMEAPAGSIVYETRVRPAPPMPPVPGMPQGRPGPYISADDEPPELPKPPPAQAPVQTAMPGAEPAAPPPLTLVGEAFKTYILAQRGDTLCLIDKHAAHERLLYDKLAAARAAPGVQLLLAPVAVSLAAAEKEALLQNPEALAAAGIELEDFGGAAVLVRGVPADVETGDVAALVEEVAGRLLLNARDNLNGKTEWVLHSVACRAAVKAGQHTPPEALLRLANDIMSGEAPPFCPHGRPVVLEITRRELERQFGRLG